MENYLQAAGKVIEAAKPDRIFSLLPGGDLEDREVARENLAQFATRAFRRPIDDVVLASLLGLYEQVRARGESFDAALRLCYRAILISPQFLFRVEQDHPGPTAHHIDDYELASRLSYFLWSTMPDAELFRAATEGKLHQATVLETQVRRMLLDPKARVFAENFAGQWLRTKELLTAANPSTDRFPQFTPELRAALYAEPLEFFLRLFQENGALTDCLDADYTYVNEVLARHYGIEDVQGDAVRRVALSDKTRGGVLRWERF
jgi:hypothetical protein